MNKINKMNKNTQTVCNFEQPTACIYISVLKHKHDIMVNKQSFCFWDH